MELGSSNSRTSRGEHNPGDSLLGVTIVSVTPSPSSWAVVTVLMACAGMLFILGT